MRDTPLLDGMLMTRLPPSVAEPLMSSPPTTPRPSWYTPPRSTSTTRRDGSNHRRRGTMAKRIGFGNYQYEVVEHWPKVEIRGAVADVCVDARGRVDAGVHTITKHAPTGELLLALGTKGHPGPDGQPFNLPTHAVEAPNGDIFVSDGYGQNRIHRFSAKGEHLLTFGGGDSVFIPKRFNLGPVTGRPGTDPCQFNVPHELLVTEDQRVYVMDRENHRWQVFTTEGAFVSLQEHVSHPNRVALDTDGTFHIAGGAGIEFWKRDGTKIGSWR